MATTIAKVKKGDTVIMRMFTGCPTAVKTVIAADKTTITVEAKNGGEFVFDRKTGKQITPTPKSEKYANYITEDDGSFVAPKRTPKKTKKTKEEVKTKAVEEPVEEAVEEPEEEELEEIADDDEFDEDEFEEID